MGSGDAHGEGEFAGAVGEIAIAFGMAAANAHFGDACDRFQRANEYASGTAFGLGRDVEALVHPINEIDVGVPRRSEQYFGALREAAPGMGCAIGQAEIRFGLDDARGYRTVHEYFA